MTLTNSTRHRLALTGLSALCLSAALACTGVVTEKGAEEGPGSGSGGPGSTPGQTLKGEDPGSKTMHRLNSAEYNNTVADVLGSTLAPADSLWSNEEDHGFDNIAKALRVDDKQFQRYFDAAGLIADDLFANAALKANVVTCATADDAACVQGVIGATGLRLFRRPLTADEVGTYEKVYQAARTLGEDHDNSLKAVLRSLLSSAEFIFRLEYDADPTSLTPHSVSSYELASRASYFLWNSAPDAELLAQAADDSILDVATFGATIDRMLADPRSDRFPRSFVGQWLGARKVAQHGVKTDIFPEWSPELASAMAEEVYQYFNEFAKGDRSWLDFLKADINYVDANLAALYGIAAPAPTMTRVEDTSDNRFGFFGTGAFLALTSYEYRTAPTLRGRWILINLLCTHPADPPPGIMPLDADPGNPDASEQNVRERLEQHRADPVCASCHAALDPYGIALENFDAIGKYRETYKNGTLIDASTITAEGVSYTGLQGLADYVGSQPLFKSCVAEKLFTYSLGRAVEETDKPYLAAVESEWLAGNPSIKDLTRRLMLADTFRFRRAAQ
jgi:hypothetical protein